jgi:hypothetical protein
MKPKKKPKKPIRTEFISVGEMKPGFWVFHPKGRSLLSYHHCECGCSGRLGTHYWYPDYEDKRAEKHFLTLDHEPHGTHKGWVTVGDPYLSKTDENLLLIPRKQASGNLLKQKTV